MSVSSQANPVERTSPGGFRAASSGPAWKNLAVEIYAPIRVEKGRIVPAVTEPQIVWVLAGSAWIEEREIGGRWLKTEVKKDDLFLTAPGPPYEMQWKATGRQPFEIMTLSLGMSVYSRAMKDVFATDARAVRLRDISGFKDSFITVLLKELRRELTAEQVSALFVQGVAQSLAVHLARRYTVVTGTIRNHRRRWGLPGFKLRKITELMSRHLEDEFNLLRFAQEASMSEFHFSRMFKSATGQSPSQYFIGLKMESARRLLKETSKSIIEIGLDVGYTSPSRFAHIFRRETGACPTAYRQQARA